MALRIRPRSFGVFAQSCRLTTSFRYDLTGSRPANAKGSATPRSVLTGKPTSLVFLFSRKIPTDVKDVTIAARINSLNFPSRENMAAF